MVDIMADKGVTLLRDYNGNDVTSKIDRLLKDVQNNPKLQAVKTSLPAFIRYVDTMDSFATLVKTNFDMKKTLMENLEAILEKYYSVTMTQNPVQVVLEQIKEVDGTPYNEAQQKAKQKLLQWADKYIGDNTLEHKWEKSDYFTIIGKAGTGKTTVARQFMYEAIQKYYAKYNRLPNICACALSHKAKEVLANSLSPLQRLYKGGSGSDGSLTFKALTGALGGKTAKYVTQEGEVGTTTIIDETNLEGAITSADIVLVDECSMVSPTYFRYIQEKRQSGSMLIFLGDSGQLMPIISENNKKEEIEAAKKCFEENYAPVSNDDISNGNYQNIQSVNGNSFTFLGIPKTKEEVDNYPNAAMLTERVRSGEGHPLLEFADHFWNVDANDPNAWWETSTLPTKITKDGAFIKSQSEEEVIEKAQDLFARGIQQSDPNMIQYCCYDNATVDDFNERMHELMGNKLGKQDYEGLPFFEGEPVYLSETNISNNNSRGVITEVSPLLDATDEWVGISRGKEIINDNLKDRNLSFKYVEITFKGNNGEIYKSRYIPSTVKDTAGNDVDNLQAFMDAVDAYKKELDETDEAIRKASDGTLKHQLEWQRAGQESAYTRLLSKYGMSVKTYKTANGGREYQYTPVLRHGYASTIHRVQGSTFETVIVNYDDLYKFKKKLGQNFPKAVYTAVTRASHVCVVIDNDNNIPPMNQNLTDVVDYVKNNRTSRNPNSGDIPTESEAMQLNKASLLYHDKLDKSKVGSMPWFESVQQNIEKLKETMKGNPNEDYGFISVEFLDNLAKTAQKLAQSGISYTDKLDFNVAGQYAAHNASINITPDSPVQEVYTCVHEILHLVSKYAIDVQNYTKTLSINSDKINADEFNQIIDAANRLGTAFKVFKKYRYSSLSNEEINATEYATKNVAEFIAELSNPVVHNAIQKIDETQGTGLIAEIKDILNKVIEWFSNNLRKLFKKKANEPEIKSLMDFTKKALNDLVLASNKDSFNLYTAMSRVIQSNNAIFENNSAVTNALGRIIEEKENEDGTVTLTKKTKYDDKIKNPPVIPSFIKDLKGTLITLSDKHYYVSNVVYRPQVSEYLKKDRNHFELTLTPVNDLTMGLNAIKKSIDGLGEVYALKDTEKIYNDTNLSDLYLDYKLENKAKQEDERITEVKKIVNKYDLQSNEGNIDFSMTYPMVSEGLFYNLYDHLAYNSPFTDDQWLQLAKEMKVKLDYGKSLSSMGIEVTSIADIENNATNPTKIKAYRVKSVDGYDPQTAFNNKIMGNPFSRWFGVKEELKKEGVSEEEIDNHPRLLSAKRADQNQFVNWLISGDNNGNTRATKALRDAYLSIIEDAANNKANNQIMYYLDTHPYTSHAAAIQAIINNWDSIKSEVKPFNKQGSSKPIRNSATQTVVSNTLQGYNIHSGGAVGADSIWKQITTRYGASYKGYYVEDPNNPNNKPPEGNIKVIWCNNEEEVEQKTTPTTVGVIKSDALTILGLAAERLSRNVAKMASNKDTQYAYNLILRDYVQVIKSDQVIAVGELSLATNQVKGGTGYAVEMAKVLNISGNPRPIYVFNTLDEKWYKCSNDTSYGVTFFESAVPTLTKNTACIGTRGPLDDRNQHVFASAWKQAMEDVVNKTILRDTKMEDWDAVLPTLSKSDRERLANNLDSQGNTAKSDFDDYLTDESKNNVVEVTTNAEGITEYNIRRVSKDMTEENKTLTVRGGTALFNELMNHQAKRGDIIRVQTDKSLIMRTIDKIEGDGNGFTIYYLNKQTINYSGTKLRSNSPSQLTANMKELKAAQDKKQSLKQQLGSDVYAQRVKYIARRLRNYVLKLKDRAVAAKAESNGQTLDENASIADTLNFFGYDKVKAGFKHSIAKHLPENVKGGEEEKALAKDNVISGWATNAVEKGIFNDIEEAKNYYSQNVFDVKMEANRQIVSDENFDTFFVDTLVQFSRDNDVDIDIYTVEKKKDKATTHTEKSETQLSDSDSTIKDAEYETVEKWQVGETHALSSASTRLKNFLNSVPLRGKDGKIKLDDISEPIFLPANRVYNQMQDLMHDCFTFTDLMDKLKKMGKNSPIYKSIYELLANDTVSKDNKSDKWNGQLKKIGNQIGTELFILLNNEEIEYENWYTDYLGKGDERIKRFNVKYENPANAAKDTLSIVTRNANEGVSYVSAKHNQPQFNKRNLGKDSITKDEANVYSAWMGVIYNYTSSASKGYFSDLLGKDFDNIEEYKNRVNSDKVKGDIKAIRNILWSLGYTIDEEDLMDNFNNTSERSFPMVDICNAIQSFMQRFKETIDTTRKKTGKASPDDVTNLAKYLETKEGKSLMYTLCTVCPMTSKVADKQSVTYINGNNYPKFKPVSSLGSLLKHIKDPNKERRERYIQEQFKNISWFYSTGNVDEIREKLIGIREELAIKTNVRDTAIINSILELLNENDINEDAINKQISHLSAETKGKLINERHPSDSIVTVPKWNNVTIQKIMDSQVIANKVKRHRIVAFNKNGYFKWDKDDFSLMALDKFYQYDSTDSAYADFLMPIYSDAGVMEFITLPKVGNPAADYESRINACVDSLMMSYRQELGRIKLIKERKQWRLDSIEAFNAFMSNKSRESLANDNQKACYDDYVEQANRTSKESIQVTDGYYYSLPIQNLEDVESLKWNGSKWVLETSKDGQGKYFNFFSFLYKYAPNIENESLSESQVRNYIMEELKTEALRLQDVVDNNKYGHYDVQKKYAKKERDKYTSYRRSKDETHNRNIFDRLFEFTCENMCAHIAIVEMTVTDMAQYQDAIDFQKRFKEVYAGTKRLNTTYHPILNPYAREDYAQILLKDIFRKNRNTGDFEALVRASDLPKAQKEWLIKTYGKINLTDAQSYRSLSSMRAVMSMSGEWKKSYDKIFDKLEKGEQLTMKELQTFFQPRKPFVFTHKLVDAKNSADKQHNDKMKIGFQIKNSEFLLMYIYSQTNTLKGVNGAAIRGLNQFMEDNRLDCIHFNSGIKVGGQGAIDIDNAQLESRIKEVNPREYDMEDITERRKYYDALEKSVRDAAENGTIDQEEYQKVKETVKQRPTERWRYENLYKEAFQNEQDRIFEDTQKLLYKISGLVKHNKEYDSNNNEIKETDDEKLARLKAANPEFINIIPYSEYGIISSTPEHFMGKKQKLGTQLMRLLTSDNLGTTYKVKAGGQELSLDGKHVFYHLSKLLAAKALIHHDKIDQTFKNDDDLLAYLLKQMQGNDKYSPATMDAIQYKNENGKLVLLGDNVVRKQIESLLNSFIREEINDVELDGGTCIQVTAALSDDLKIKYTKDAQGNRIKYWECRMPIALKEVYNLAADEKGFLSVENLMNNKLINQATKEKLLKCIGCRVPTESKHSIQHLKCVEFLPSNSGSCIMLPYEITKTSGADFDIDKLYLWRYSFEMVEMEHDGRKIKIPKYVDYANEEIHKMSEKQINNAIIDLFWTVLEHPASAMQELIPNSYDNTQKAAYIGTLFHGESYNKVIERKFNESEEEKAKQDPDYVKREYTQKNKLKFLQEMDIDTLQSWYSIGLNRCSLLNQTYFFDLNSKGKGMLGIMAVNNVFLSLLQHTKVSVRPQYAVTINGHTPYKLYERTVDKNGEKYLSSLTLSEFLAAAPDSAKDPTLVFLGINNQNVNALVGAALLNYDIQDIALMFNHPVLKEFFSDVKAGARLTANDVAMKIIRMFTPEEDGVYDYENTHPLLKQALSYDETGETYKNKQGKDVPIRELHPHDTSGLKEFDISMDDLLGESDPNDISDDSKIKILVAFYKMFQVGSALNNLAQVTRQDSTSGSTSATMSGDISKWQKIKRVMKELTYKDSPLNIGGALLDTTPLSDDIDPNDEATRKSLIDNIGNEHDNPLGYIQVQLTYGLMNAFKYGKNRLPNFSPFLMKCYETLAETTPYGYLNEDVIELLVNDFLKWKLSNISFFGSQMVEIKNQKTGNTESYYMPLEQKMSIIVNETWEDINTVKMEYNLANNKLLNSLKTNKLGVIILEDAGQLTQEEKKDLTEAWEDLLNSPYDRVRMLGYNLIRYSFYRNTMKFAPDGFGHLCPDVRKTIPGYVQAMEESLTQKEDGYAAFLSRFVANNAKYLQTTKKRNLRDDQESWIQESNMPEQDLVKAEREMQSDDVWNQDDVEYSGFDEEASFEDAKSADTGKSYSFVLRGTETEKEEYYKLMPAQIVPTTNLYEWERYESDGTVVTEVNTVDSKTNDFTYYPQKDDADILPFIETTDNAWQTNSYKKSTFTFVGMETKTAERDMYDELQELKDKGQLISTTNIC